MRVDREIDGFQFAHFTRDRQRVFKGEIGRQPVNRDRKCNRHADQDHDHLVALRDAYNFGPADHCVDNDETAREPDGQVQAPAEQRGENNSRRVDRDSGSDASLDEKQKCAE